jgi:ERCC4-type nuclease
LFATDVGATIGMPASPSVASVAAGEASMHDPTFLVAPTEPAGLRRLGTVSPLPEHHGCDVVWASGAGLVGVQRKELTDLWSSLRDGRLAREVDAMRLLAVRMLLVEGRVRWSSAGRLTTARSPLTRDQLRGLLLSAQHRGLWVVHTDDVDDSATALLHLRRWLDKRHHSAFAWRPPMPAHGGAPGSRAWGVHLLQGFPLVGPVVAAAIWDHFGGVPLGWRCDVADLAQVKGVGPARATSLWAALPPDPPQDVA